MEPKMELSKQDNGHEQNSHMNMHKLHQHPT